MKVDKSMRYWVIGGVLFFWAVFVWIAITTLNRRADYRSRFYLINIPKFETMDIKLEHIHSDTSFLNYRGKMLLYLKQRGDFYVLYLSGYRFFIPFNKIDSSTIKIAPIPNNPLSIEQYKNYNTIFLPVRVLEGKRYSIGLAPKGNIYLHDNESKMVTKLKKNQYSFGRYKIHFYVERMPQGVILRIEFSPFIKLLLVPKSYKEVIVGNYHAYFEYPHLLPQYIYPYDFYRDVSILCSNGVISYDREKKEITVSFPKNDSLKAVFNRVFMVVNKNGKKVLVWRRYRNVLSPIARGNRSNKLSLYGAFSPGYLSIWEIEKGHVIGLRPNILKEDISLENLFNYDLLSHVKDRKGAPLYNANTPVLPSLWNVLPPAYIARTLRNYIIRHDISSQLKFIVTGERFNDVRLTIDKDVQEKLEISINKFVKNTSPGVKEYFGKVFGLSYPHIGAVVLSDDGEILAAVSYPFPKNRKEFIYWATKEIKMGYLNSPLLNRTWKRIYPAGSIVKPFVAGLAVEKGMYVQKGTKIYVPDVNHPDKVFVDNSGVLMNVKGVKIKPLYNDHRKKYSFPITYRDFIARSINVVSASLLCAMSERDINRFLGLFDNEDIFMLNKTFIKMVPQSVDYSYTNPFWGFGGRVENRTWRSLTTVSRFAIGDKIYVSPLYITGLYVSLYRNRMIRPHLINDGVFKGHKLFDSKSVSDFVIDCMRGVVEDKHGTAYNVFGKDKRIARLIKDGVIAVFGKTGTAQVKRKRAHKWFVGGMRVAGRQYFIGVVVENAGGLYPYNPAAKIVYNFLLELIRD